MWIDPRNPAGHRAGARQTRRSTDATRQAEGHVADEVQGDPGADPGEAIGVGDRASVPSASQLAGVMEGDGAAPRPRAVREQLADGAAHEAGGRARAVAWSQGVGVGSFKKLLGTDRMNASQKAALVRDAQG